jgi:1-acyl-sn-glycerol-3-phosphate acyltransferase
VIAEHARLLSRTERVAVRLGDFVAKHCKMGATLWNLCVITPLVWLAIGLRLDAHGLASLRTYGSRVPLVLVANHRSRYDFFAITAVVRVYGGLLRHFLFPIRSSYFYDHPLGVVLNFFSAGMGMFPPLFREPSRRALNVWSLSRCTEELQRLRRVIGIHPEGTRNRGEDPYDLAEPKPGVGKIVLEAPGARVVPVFIIGIGDNPLAELFYNLRPGRHPVRILFGDEVGVEDLRAEGSRPMTQKRATERCMAALRALAADARALASTEREPRLVAGAERGEHA